MSNCDIPTEEIKADIKETQEEIEGLRLVTNGLRKLGLQENKTKIYLNEGEINLRIEFITKLNKILKERENVK